MSYIGNEIYYNTTLGILGAPYLIRFGEMGSIPMFSRGGGSPYPSVKGRYPLNFCEGKVLLYLLTKVMKGVLLISDQCKGDGIPLPMKG